ncbi:MAG: hypothetical protein F4017_03980 [Acidimicrobiaceae bacterium]|nr:hypothetical protein [Acidimicrobiaceae bacterium]
MLDEHPDNGRAFRLLVLQTHYRKTMEVNPDLMASARSACQRLDALARRAAVLEASRDRDGGQRGGAAIDAFRAVVGEHLDASELQEVVERLASTSGRATVKKLTRRFSAAMDHDLGTPEAVAVVFDTLRRANAELDAGSPDGPVFAGMVANLAGVMGLAVGSGGYGDGAGDGAIEDLVARRQAAREDKDWATADALRDELSALGVVVEDTPAGPIWYRTAGGE